MKRWLTTKCKECIHLRNQKQCTIGMHTFLDEKEKCETHGLCIKKAFSLQDQHTKEDANTKISCVILSVDGDIRNIIRTIKSAKKQEDIYQIIVCTKQTDCRPLIIKALQKTDKQWAFQEINTDWIDTSQYIALMDLSAKDILYKWTYFIDAGKKIQEDMVRSFQKKKNGIVCVYKASGQYYNIIISTYAFEQLEFNYGIPCLDKILDFENRNKVCEKVK